MASLRRWRVVGPLLCILAGCAHGPFGRGGISRSAQRFADEAASVKGIAYEEDFLEARLLLQALPLNARERPALRLKLVDYLVGPVARLDLEQVRKDPAYLGGSDEIDRVFDAFHDALELYAPAELWTAGATALLPEERRILGNTARAVVTLFSPRGNEQAVATGLFVLVTLEPSEKAWRDRLDQLFAWLETGSQISSGPGRRPRRRHHHRRRARRRGERLARRRRSSIASPSSR
jgi:hypothetical protein